MPIYSSFGTPWLSTILLFLSRKIFNDKAHCHCAYIMVKSITYNTSLFNLLMIKQSTLSCTLYLVIALSSRLRKHGLHRYPKGLEYTRGFTISWQWFTVTITVGLLRWKRTFPIDLFGTNYYVSNRTLDGRLNNPKKIFNGAVGEDLLRLSVNGYADKRFVLSGACSPSQRQSKTCPFPKENNGTGSNRPNPRVISNSIVSQVREYVFANSVYIIENNFNIYLAHLEVTLSNL